MYEQKRDVKTASKKPPQLKMTPTGTSVKCKQDAAGWGGAQVQVWPVDIRHSEFRAESPPQRRAVRAPGNLEVPMTLQGKRGTDCKLPRRGESRGGGTVTPLLLPGAAGLHWTEKHPRQ